MKNTFYNEFDEEVWDGPRLGDYRSAFQQDRDRLLHSSAFRRLQAKTQVFRTGEYDFYRTRLTHSLEVAQIARSICEFLKQSSKFLSDDFYIDPNLVEAVGLAHDLGHPPFGHSGETELNRIMKKFGGFEGNAQTLRLLTKIIYTRGVNPAGCIRRSGMSPTRAFMDGVMKYKVLRKHKINPTNHFIFDDQAECLGFVFAERVIPPPMLQNDQLNNFRSIECQIMDWADDTAYRLNDLVDGANAGFINKAKVEEWASSANLSKTERGMVDKLLNAISRRMLTQYVSTKIGDFIQACELLETNNFMSDLTNRYRYKLKIANEVVRVEHKLYKQLASQIVFNSPQLHQLEFKGKAMIRGIFRAFWSNYNSDSPAMLLPTEVDACIRPIKNPQRRARLLCDHVAGMSDDFATRTYRRLFDPGYGSMVDLV